MADYQDYSYLIVKYRELIQAQIINQKCNIWNFDAEEQLASQNKINFGQCKKNNIVLADSTAIELGSPNSKSLWSHMWTSKPNLVQNQILTCGTEITNIQKSSKYFLVFLLFEITPLTTHIDFRGDRRVNLTQLIPGFMSRSLGNRLWIRIHHELFNKHFSLQQMGYKLYAEYRHKYPEIAKMEILILVDDNELYHSLEPLGTAADIIAGDNRKLRWVDDGIVSCSDLNCSTCEEKSTCDALREIVTKRRRTV